MADECLTEHRRFESRPTRYFLSVSYSVPCTTRVISIIGPPYSSIAYGNGQNKEGKWLIGELVIFTSIIKNNKTYQNSDM